MTVAANRYLVSNVFITTEVEARAWLDAGGYRLAEKHAVDLRQPYPVCSGNQWVFDSTPAKVGAIVAHARHCSSCGNTMFIKAE